MSNKNENRSIGIRALSLMLAFAMTITSITPFQLPVGAKTHSKETSKSEAVFDEGTIVNSTLKELAGISGATYEDEENTVEAIQWAKEMPDDVDAEVISSKDSKEKIYAWHMTADEQAEAAEEETAKYLDVYPEIDTSSLDEHIFKDSIFLYTEADTVSLNEDASYMLSGFSMLEDVRALYRVDFSETKDMSNFLSGDTWLSDLNPISFADMSSVENVDSMFMNDSSITDTTAIETHEVTYNTLADAKDLSYADDPMKEIREDVYYLQKDALDAAKEARPKAESETETETEEADTASNESTDESAEGESIAETEATTQEETEAIEETESLEPEVIFELDEPEEQVEDNHVDEDYVVYTAWEIPEGTSMKDTFSETSVASTPYWYVEKAEEETTESTEEETAEETETATEAETEEPTTEEVVEETSEETKEDATSELETAESAEETKAEESKSESTETETKAKEAKDSVVFRVTPDGEAGLIKITDEAGNVYNYLTGLDTDAESDISLKIGQKVKIEAYPETGYQINSVSIQKNKNTPKGEAKEEVKQNEEATEVESTVAETEQTEVQESAVEEQNEEAVETSEESSEETEESEESAAVESTEEQAEAESAEIESEEQVEESVTETESIEETVPESEEETTEQTEGTAFDEQETAAEEETQTEESITETEKAETTDKELVSEAIELEDKAQLQTEITITEDMAGLTVSFGEKDVEGTVVSESTNSMTAAEAMFNSAYIYNHLDQKYISNVDLTTFVNPVGTIRMGAAYTYEGGSEITIGDENENLIANYNYVGVLYNPDPESDYYVTIVNAELGQGKPYTADVVYNNNNGENLPKSGYHFDEDTSIMYIKKSFIDNPATSETISEDVPVAIQAGYQHKTYTKRIPVVISDTEGKDFVYKDVIVDNYLDTITIISNLLTPTSGIDKSKVYVMLNGTLFPMLDGQYDYEEDTGDLYIYDTPAGISSISIIIEEEGALSKMTGSLKDLFVGEAHAKDKWANYYTKVNIDHSKMRAYEDMKGNPIYLSSDTYDDIYVGWRGYYTANTIEGSLEDAAEDDEEIKLTDATTASYAYGRTGTLRKALGKWWVHSAKYLYGGVGPQVFDTKYGTVAGNYAIISFTKAENAQSLKNLEADSSDNIPSGYKNPKAWFDDYRGSLKMFFEDKKTGKADSTLNDKSVTKEINNNDRVVRLGAFGVLNYAMKLPDVIKGANKSLVKNKSSKDQGKVTLTSDNTASFGGKIWLAGFCTHFSKKANLDPSEDNFMRGKVYVSCLAKGEAKETKYVVLAFTPKYSTNNQTGFAVYRFLVDDAPKSVEVTKLDAATRKNLTGAEFKLYEYSDKASKKAGKDKWKTVGLLEEKEKGRYVMDSFYVHYADNKKGKFKIVETKNPKGYTGSFVKEFKVKPNGPKSQKFTYNAYNYRKVNIYVPKVDKKTNQPLQGATIQLTQYNSASRKFATYTATERSDKGLLSFVTNQTSPYKNYYGITGVLVTPVSDEGQGNYGKFKITETAPPEGYTGSFTLNLNVDNPGNKWEVKQESDNTWSYIYKENQKNPSYSSSRVKITKVDKNGAVIPTTNGVFKVYASYNGRANDSKYIEIDTLKWNSAQKAYISTKDYEWDDDSSSAGKEAGSNNHGYFKVVEIKAPDGYVKDGSNDTWYFHAEKIVNTTGPQLFTKTYVNEANGFELIKKDEKGQLMKGIEFTFKRQGGSSFTKATDANGKIALEALKPGVYEYYESKTDATHVRNKNKFYFTVDNDNLLKDDKNPTPKKKLVVDGIKNYPFFNIGMTKYADMTTAGGTANQTTVNEKRFPAGTEISFYKKNGNSYPSKSTFVMAYSTSKKAFVNKDTQEVPRIEVDSDNFSVTYKFKETKPSSGFLLDSTEYELTVTKSGYTVKKVSDGSVVAQSTNLQPGATIPLTLTNKPNHLKMVKVALDGSPLAGAMMQIYKKGTVPTTNYTSNSSGVIVDWYAVETGKWVYREVKAPEGYAIDTREYEFEVLENGTIKYKNENEAGIRVQETKADATVKVTNKQAFKIKIKKYDSKTGQEFDLHTAFPKGTRFQIYEWSKSKDNGAGGWQTLNPISNALPNTEISGRNSAPLNTFAIPRHGAKLQDNEEMTNIDSSGNAENETQESNSEESEEESEPSLADKVGAMADKFKSSALSVMPIHMVQAADFKLNDAGSKPNGYGDQQSDDLGARYVNKSGGTINNKGGKLYIYVYDASSGTSTEIDHDYFTITSALTKSTLHAAIGTNNKIRITKSGTDATKDDDHVRFNINIHIGPNYLATGDHELHIPGYTSGDTSTAAKAKAANWNPVECGFTSRYGYLAGWGYSASGYDKTLTVKANEEAAGWRINNNHCYVKDHSAAIQLYVRYMANITWDANGGSSTTSKRYCSGLPFTHKYSGSLTALPTVSRTGYTFAGWYTAKSGGTKIAVTSQVPATDTTYYAHWTPNNYTVTYNKQNGTANVSKSHAYDSTVTISSDIANPTRTGYTFTGWYTEATNGTKYGATFKMTGNRTIYAHWRKNKTTIRYNANGGIAGTPNNGYTVGSNNLIYKNGALLTVSVEYGNTVNLHDVGYWYNPSSTDAYNIHRPGYSYNGFKTTKGTNIDKDSATYAQINDNTTPSGDNTVDVYLQWKPNVLTVNFYKNGATLNELTGTNPSDLLSTSTYNYDATNLATYGLPNANGGSWKLRKTGYHATNKWHIGSATGSTISADTGYAKVQDAATAMGVNLSTANRTVNLYADWEGDFFKVNFNPVDGVLDGTSFGANNGTETATTLQTQYMSMQNDAGMKAKKTGYVFMGFYTAPEGGEMVYDKNGSYVAGTYWDASGKWKYENGTNDTTTIQLYAQYKQEVGFVDNKTHEFPNLSITADNEGKFKIVETKAAPGYIMDDVPVELHFNSDNGTVTVLKGSTTVATYHVKESEMTAAEKQLLINENTGEINIPAEFNNTPNYWRLHKKDAVNNQNVNGATFRVWNDEGTYNQSYVSGATGYAGEIDDGFGWTEGGNYVYGLHRLPEGHYNYQETAAPSGYLLNRTIGHFTVNKDGRIGESSFGEVTSLNSPTGHPRFSVAKEDANHKPLSGIVFNITKPDGTAYHPNNGTSGNCATNARGFFTFHEFTAADAGTWTVQESATQPNLPEGVMINTNTYTFTVSSDGKTVTYDGTTINNGIIITVVDDFNAVEITKIDEDTNRTISGVKFDVTDPDNNVKEYTTDANGIITISKLKDGKWSYREQETNGYKADRTIHYFLVQNGMIVECDENGTAKDGSTPTAKFTVTHKNSPTHLKLKKTDEKGNPLSGVTFTFTKVNGDKVSFTEITGADGYINTTQLTAGEWIYRETGSKPGYINNSDEGSFIVNADGSVDIINADGTKTKNVEELPAMVNPSNRVRIKKIDDKENIVAGAVFTLKGPGRGTNGEDRTTDENGIAEWTNLIEGSYTIEEKSVPAGYIKSSQTFTITADAAGEVTCDDESASLEDGILTVTAVNRKSSKVSVEIKKRDANTQALLKGAIFELFKENADGEFVTTGKKSTDNGDGTYSFGDWTYDGLKEEKYRIVEIKAPDGYIPDFSHEFLLDSTDEDYNFTGENSIIADNNPVPFKLYKVEEGTMTTADEDVVPVDDVQSFAHDMSGVAYVLPYKAEAVNTITLVTDGNDGSTPSRTVLYNSETDTEETLRQYLNADNRAITNISATHTYDVMEVSYTHMPTVAGDPINGIQFKIWKDGTEGAIYTTGNNANGEDGIIDMTGLLSDGTWYLQEVNSEDENGNVYRTNPNRYSFVVANGKVTSDNMIINGDEAIVTMTNKPTNDGGFFKLTKTDEEGNLLPGAVFRIYQWNSTLPGQNANEPGAFETTPIDTMKYQTETTDTPSADNIGQTAGDLSEDDLADPSTDTEEIDITESFWAKDFNAEWTGNDAIVVELSHNPTDSLTVTLADSATGTPIITEDWEYENNILTIQNSEQFKNLDNVYVTVSYNYETKIVENSTETIKATDYNSAWVNTDDVIVELSRIPDGIVSVKIAESATGTQTTLEDTDWSLTSNLLTINHKDWGNVADLYVTVEYTYSNETDDVQGTNGYYISSYLPYTGTNLGKFKIVEEVAPAGGYAADFTYVGTLNLDAENQPYVVGSTVEDEIVAVNGPNELKIRKVDENGNPLAGAKFTLALKEVPVDSPTYDDDIEALNRHKVEFGNYNVTKETDANGFITFEKLPEWTYVLTESEPPAGYSGEGIQYDVVVNDKGLISVVGDEAHAAKEYTINVTNHKNSVELFKVDGQTNTAIAGAQFKIWRENVVVLTPATYEGAEPEETRMEASYPTGYDTASHEVISWGASDTGTRFTTGSDGKIYFSKLPDGIYHYEETQVPSPYICDAKGTFIVENGSIKETAESDPVSSLQIKASNFSSPQSGSVILEKVANNPERTELEGAVFAVAEYMPDKGESGEYALTMENVLYDLTKTAENEPAIEIDQTTTQLIKDMPGVYMLTYDVATHTYIANDLPINGINQGKYIVYELFPPTGYVADYIEEFVLTAANNQFVRTGEQAVVNDVIDLKLCKYAEDTTEPLNGAVYQYWYEADNGEKSEKTTLPATGSSGETGMVKIPITELGATYYVQEVTPPTGYELIPDPQGIAYVGVDGSINMTGYDPSREGTVIANVTDPPSDEPELPILHLHTGSAGRRMIYLLGLAIAIAASLFTVMDGEKKKQKQ